MMNRLSILVLVGVPFGLTHCSQSSFNRRHDPKTPFVENVSEETVSRVPLDEPNASVDAASNTNLVQADRQLMEKNATPASSAVTGQVRFAKAAIFDREFLYGFDLQYSSGADAEYELIPQAMALGHVPSFFRRIGDRLQLIADQSRLFESDINHPELLINEYLIVAEDADSLSVDFHQGGVVLNQFTAGKAAPLPKQTWIRSIEFKAESNVLLQETGLLMADGSVATFMESLLPRAALVPADYKGLEANSAQEPLAGRYGFLAGESVFVPGENSNGGVIRRQTAFASRFHLGENGTIDWYVTPNIPDKFLPAIKSGVEGWNRYFKPQHGREVVRFLGKMPQGAKIGDPTLNIINWDSVAEAGAAYESQAVDPLTGIQSHSLIYLPLAWYNIGVSLWKGRVDAAQPSEQELRALLSPKSPEVLFGRRNLLSCMRSADNLAAPMEALLSAVKGGQEPSLRSLDDFGMRLLTATLFHEVGHALGLDHNFKGSLAFDAELPITAENRPTYSVMDYNLYQLEMDLFDVLGSGEGPLQEYDRQIISQLYNAGKNVTPADLVIDTCNDAAADDTGFGVDPLCVRYDSEKNPIDGVIHAFKNLAEPSNAKGIDAQTLTEAMLSIKASLVEQIGNAEKVSSHELLQEKAASLGASIGNLVNYYVASGAQSLRVSIRNNEKALRAWQSGISVDELRFRSEFLKIFNDSLGLQGLPAAPAGALADIGSALERAAIANTAIAPTEQERIAHAQAARLDFENSVSGKTKTGLSRLRQAIYGILGYSAENSFALRLNPSGAISSFEELAVNTLANGVLASLSLEPGERAALQGERAAAAEQLKTFAPISEKVAEVRGKLGDILVQAKASGDLALLQETRWLQAALK